MNIVFFDIGNTNVKLLHNNRIFKIKTESFIKNYHRFLKQDILYFGSCVKLDLRKKLEKYKNIFFLKDFKKFIKTKYDFKNIGEDRLASLYFPSEKNFIVLQLGTLYTLDIVKNKFHIGGYLIPSLKTIHTGITNTTSIKLPNYFLFLKNIEKVSINKIPKNTQHAILNGFINIFFSFLKNVKRQWPYPLYVSGGDYILLERFFSFFDIKVKYIKYIVLFGLKNFFIKYKIHEVIKNGYV